jgi:hypothetical protein
MNGQVSLFLEDRLIANGEREEITRVVEERYPADQGAIRVFDDATGKVVDLDIWDALKSAPPPRGRGRPKLGVTAREVTLLPRHWEWLATQPGGASAALRRLVEEARKGTPHRTERQRRDAAYHFMQAMCGDRTGYEEALRALYKGEEAAFAQIVSSWPEDIRTYIEKLLA